jgi:hypothetical protein
MASCSGSRPMTIWRVARAVGRGFECASARGSGAAGRFPVALPRPPLAAAASAGSDPGVRQHRRQARGEAIGGSGSTRW